MLRDLATAYLQPFRSELAPIILAWARTDAELDSWAATSERSVDVFAAWHAEPDVLAFVLYVGDESCAYGEIWQEAGEAELARVIVAPEQRGRGVGRTLMRLLAAHAIAQERRPIWVRVLPSNTAALLCYRAAGFVRAAQAEERAFNAEQPRQYVWLRYS